MPLDEHGHPIPVADGRWWCDQHKAEAGPDDDLPPDDLRPRLDFVTMRPLPSSAIAHEVSVADDLAFCADAKVVRCSGETKLGPSYSGAPRISRYRR